MGVKGLQGFVENACPGTCVAVNLKEMAEQRRRARPGRPPTLVVDGTACLRHWYSCAAWVHGGQWREYTRVLESFAGAFAEAGIRLVFVFDGAVEEAKRAEWAQRRLRHGREIRGAFRYVKAHGRQPGREMFCLPSGLATFSRFALKALGAETRCSVREADYEIAGYAALHDCMGILGQDTDFLIYDSVPYLSVSQLRLERMETVLFSRENLCRALRLRQSDLPLLACILGNDVVPQGRLEGLRNKCLAAYRQKHPGASTPADKVLAVADFISSHCCSRGGISELPLSEADQAVLEQGVRMYLLPNQQSPWVPSGSEPPSSESMNSLERYSSHDVLQAAKEQHVRAESFMVFDVLSAGVVDCSNTLEDEEDTEFPGQAITFRPARERIYGILFAVKQGDSGPAPAVKEWFVYRGNSLRQPDLVTPAPLSLPEGTPDLKVLWFSEAPETKALRFSTFLAVFDLLDLAEELEKLESPLAAVVCLVTYIALQERSLCLEDVNAYVSQAVCVREKTHEELAGIKLPVVDPRAIELGSLFVRGLTILIAANSASGFPLKMEDLMPWKVFDGLLFHSKYLQAHSGYSEDDLLEGTECWVSQFGHLKALVTSACGRRNRVVQSNPRASVPVKPRGGGCQSRERRPQHFREPEPGQFSAPSSRFQYRGHSVPQQERGHRPRYRGPSRQRYHLAPRWSLFQNTRPNFP
ncbi:constitutive coactivator of peroxisome proliferator-activated receptor gamma [Lepisosteus oculatus]|uniref:constitutive coactivator of peroxisome proliferator-activated receptor gamma n=1 Tax=Lepisosteus oculatus TaxID=7918 RepID=UPI0035F51DFE